MGPFLSNKGSNRSQITVVSNEEIISDDSQVAETMNNYFEKAVKSLNITENQYHLSSTSSSNDGPIETAIKKFNCHPSIIAINRNFTIASYFNFVKVNPSNIDEEISKLNTNKAGIKSDIPSKLLKDISDISSQHLSNIWNREIIENKVFSGNLKKANICPIFKKIEHLLKIIGQLVYYQMCQRFLNEFYKPNYFLTWKNFFRLFYVAIEKVITHKGP